MCGRFARIDSISFLAEKFDIDEINSFLPVSYNISPGSDIAAIENLRGKRIISTYGWGIPSRWNRDKKPSLLFNARSETILEKPSFREAALKRRCAVPASGYYEWEKKPDGKLPYYFTSSRKEPLMLAAVYDKYDEKKTCSILTMNASREISHIHHRMPLILSGDTLDWWINSESEIDSELINKAAEVSGAEKISFHRVSSLVNSSLYNQPEAVHPL